MRVTNNMMISNMTRNLQTNIRRLDKTQMQYNTGKRIHKPSDDPVGITRSLKVRADISELRQHKKNVEDATSWLENTEQAVVSNHEALKRLRDLMVQGANGVLTTEETIKIQNEVVELKNQIISQANTTYAGDYVFSGKKTDEPLLNSDGTYNVKNMKSLDHDIKYEIGVGEYITVNTIGTSLFEVEDLNLPGADTEKPGLINLIERIEKNLEEGNHEEIDALLGPIDKFLDQSLVVRGEIGAKVNRTELIFNRIEDDIINLRALQSKLEDADMAETAIQLMNEENVYRSSLSVGARIIQPTLLDFLR